MLFSALCILIHFYIVWAHPVNNMLLLSQISDPQKYAIWLLRELLNPKLEERRYFRNFTVAGPVQVNSAKKQIRKI